jgi:hypothetical protein
MWKKLLKKAKEEKLYTEREALSRQEEKQPAVLVEEKNPLPVIA